jgi:hypothetical protein
VATFFEKNTVVEPSISISNPTPTKVEKYIPPKTTYVCDGRQHCFQMGSYEEAKCFIQHCLDTKMDRDRDGIPCEKQFNKWKFIVRYSVSV